MPKREPSIQFILMRAGDALDHAMNWRDHLFDTAFPETVSSLNRAVALIELVEEIDCGQIGGFGDGQSTHESRTLFHRWKWLCQKYWPDFAEANGEGNGQAYFNYAEMEEFYEK